MARPREFDREAALDRAIDAFWTKGFAATSTEDLVEAMGIGRQSLYNAFGDKRALYLEALEAYQQRTIAGHVDRLSKPQSPAHGLQDLLYGLIAKSDLERVKGCMGVCAAAEFGVSDSEIAALRAKASPALGKRLVERIAEGQQRGELDAGMNPKEAAGFVQMTMTGIQLGARAGAPPSDLRSMARFAVDRLKRS